jgi:hypothetical protein
LEENVKKIDEVIPCVCGTMPVLHVRNCGNRKQEYGAQCPKCGRGMETGAGKTNWSAYSALKEWNKMQLGLRGEKHEK